MAEAEEKRDLLQKFFYQKRNFDEIEKVEEEEIELSLGLSLNGRFGVDPKRAKNLPLIRSSSISDFMLTNENGQNDVACGVTAAGYTVAALMRTCSLPTEAEEEWRKRKEIQTLRRMEAKRKRWEKMKSAKTAKDQVVLEGGNCDENGLVAEGQGSIGSQGSGSSGISESESQLNQGSNRNGEARSPGSVQSPPKQIGPKAAVNIGTTTENPPAKLNAKSNEAKETMKNMMVDMPCVSTKGIGPNGKKIEGFLYRYRKGEEVRIVCVCHGSFLSPAEFVKHAGGGDVAQPLKHIVVNPSPLL